MKWWGRFVVLALLLAPLGACGDDPLGLDDDEEEQQEEEVNQVAFLRLVIGSTSIVINKTGTVIGPAVLIGAPGAVITAFPMDANSQPLNIDSTAFRLDVTPDVTGRITFTRTGAFSGRLARTSVGTATISVGLFHIPRNHFDFGMHTVQVTAE